MLSCRELVARAGGMVDGELRLAERMRFRAHLVLCEACRRFYRQLDALVRSLRMRSNAHGADLSREQIDRFVQTLISGATETHGERPGDA